MLDLVRELQPVTSQARKRSDVELGFVVYDAFKVRGSYDDYGWGGWAFGVVIGDDALVAEVFGEHLTICGTRDEVRSALAAIDRYARLRLGSEYLEAYEAAYS